MGKVSTEVLYVLESGGSVRLKRWSTRKFLFLIQLLGEVSKDLSDKLGIKIVKQVDPDTGLTSDRLVVNWEPKAIIDVLLNLGDQAQTKVTALIKESIADTITDDQILDWPLEDYIGVLSKILEMNLTEQIRKNLLGLRDTLIKKVKGS